MKKKLTKETPQRKTPTKPIKRAVRGSNGITADKMKKNENAILFRKIMKYEKNFTDAIICSHHEGDIFLSILLYVALYPQIQHTTNIHDYKSFHSAIQNDEVFRDKVYSNEEPESEKEDLYHYTLVPLLHQQLLEAFREVVISGATKKFKNTLHKIATEVSKGCGLHKGATKR